jgi:hypothetical protein
MRHNSELAKCARECMLIEEICSLFNTVELRESHGPPNTGGYDFYTNRKDCKDHADMCADTCIY